VNFVELYINRPGDFGQFKTKKVRNQRFFGDQFSRPVVCLFVIFKLLTRELQFGEGEMSCFDGLNNLISE
jgi:hypothetical protein